MLWMPVCCVHFCVCFFALHVNRQLRRELATELVRYTEVTFSAVSSASSVQEQEGQLTR